MIFVFVFLIYATDLCREFVLKELFHNSVEKQLFWPTNDGSKAYFSVILFRLYTSWERSHISSLATFSASKNPKARKVAIPTPRKGDRTGGIHGTAWVDIVTICQGKPETNGCNKTNVCIHWIWPPPCNSGKLRLIVIPDPKHVIILVVTGIQGGGHIKGI